MMGAGVNRYAAFAVAGIFVVAFMYFVLQVSFPLVKLKGPVEVRVEKGMSFRQAARLLRERGLIRDPYPLIVAARVTGLQRTLKPGYYSFNGTLSPWMVFQILRKGDIVESEVTVIEGDTLREIKLKLAHEGLVAGEEFERLSTDREFLLKLNVRAPSLEGYLFPDTYKFYKGVEPVEVLEIMVRRLREKYDGDLMARTSEMGLDERSVLTLASIIEKETSVDEERQIISAVYHNRLRRRMPLQADPTAVYGIKPQGAGISRKDIRRRTKYNTYFIRGLPPGPIASPGLLSIRAALYPADVPYLYFVADGNGTHTFSTTRREHERAVKRYRAARARPRS
jgi:UPF0755 protein